MLTIFLSPMHAARNLLKMYLKWNCLKPTKTKSASRPYMPFLVKMEIIYTLLYDIQPISPPFQETPKKIICKLLRIQSMCNNQSDDSHSVPINGCPHAGNARPFCRLVAHAQALKSKMVATLLVTYVTLHGGLDPIYYVSHSQHGWKSFTAIICI